MTKIMTITNLEIKTELAREIAMRRRVYANAQKKDPSDRGYMSPEDAEKKIAIMQYLYEQYAALDEGNLFDKSFSLSKWLQKAGWKYMGEDNETIPGGVRYVFQKSGMTSIIYHAGVGNFVFDLLTALDPMITGVPAPKNEIAAEVLFRLLMP